MCLTIGAYSKWLDAAPGGLSIFPSVIDILMSGMSISEDSAAAAALAFKHICDGTDSLACYYLHPSLSIHLWSIKEINLLRSSTVCRCSRMIA